MKEVLLILPYFGKFKIWSKFFFYSLGYQKNLNLLLVTDSDVDTELPNNVTVVSMTLNDFSKMVRAQIGIDIHLYYPYKITDLRPAFGVIFSKYLKDYKYWGYCDEDVLLGDVTKFIGKSLEDDYDIITSLKEHLSGHFTMIKNIDSLNNLYKADPKHVEVFKDGQHWGYDEISWFQPGAKMSFTQLVKNAADEQCLKIMWGFPIRDNLMSKFERFDWCEGRLTDHKMNEYGYYHWNHLKNAVFFRFPVWRKIPKTFSFNFGGFYHSDHLKLRTLKLVQKYIPRNLERGFYFLRTRKYY